MRLCFDSIDEVKDFVKQLKGTRGGKSGDADEGAQAGNTGQANAPAPLQPPLNGPVSGFAPAAAFAPPAAGAGPQGGGPFAPAALPSPEVSAIVNRINGRIDAAISSGQPADAALNWLRQQVTPHVAEAVSATLDQLKQHHMFRLPMPALEQIAKFMNA